MNPIKKIIPALIALVTLSCTSAGNETNAQYHHANQHDGYADQNLYAQQSIKGQAPNAASYAGNQPSGSAHVIRDPQLNNMPAIEFRVPSGYRVQGGINWEPMMGSTLPVCRVQVANAASKSALTTYPTEGRMENKSQSYQMMYQQAQQLGMSTEAFRSHPVMPEDAAMREIMMPVLQKTRGNIRLLGEESIPNLDSQLWPGQNIRNIQYRGRKLTIAYQQNGVEMVEEVYGLFYAITQTVGSDAFTVWGLDRTFGISAPAASFAGVRGELMGLASSFKTDPQYLKAVEQIIARRGQQQREESRMRMEQSSRDHQMRMANNRASFEAGQAAYRSQQQTYDMQNAAWSANQESMFKSNQSVNDAIIGQQRYVDPNSGEQHILSNQYNQQWTDGWGNTIGSDDINFDPNRYSNGTQYFELQPER